MDYADQIAEELREGLTVTTRKALAGDRNALDVLLRAAARRGYMYGFGVAS